MTQSAPTAATRTDQPPVDLPAAADAITCLLELVATQLAALRAAVREHGAGIAECGDWHVAEVLLDLASAQANLIEAASCAA